MTNEREQLILKNKNLTKERDMMELGCGLSNLQCTQSMSILSVINYRQVSINENKKLTSELVLLTVGWTCYQSSFYYMSNQMKNWTESRRYCIEKGADLIIINNGQEQDFVKNMSGTAVIYIGLTDTAEEGRWKWVDGRQRSEPDGGKGDNRADEDCAVTVAVSRTEFLNLIGWLDVECHRAFQWICEKRISQFTLP
uniref:C-type lectin domain-containing protein n=1 Tax=Sinocyclocheilus grahami TaxID=75366 RepID=A0A672KLN4_SINGR